MSKGQVALLRQILGAGGPPSRLPLAKLRRNFELLLDRFTGPEAEIRPADLPGLPGLPEDASAEWVDARQDRDRPAARTVLYLHGGGFVIGSARSHRHLIARLSHEADAVCLALDYRLAPEFPFPAALDDAGTALAALLDHPDGPRLDPRRLVMAGDSAGGGLAVMAAVRRRAAGLSLPAFLYLLSPWTDYEGTGASLAENAALDPVVQPDGLARMARHYLGNHDPWDPALCPLTAELTGLPPTLIQVGGVETLLDDSRRLHARLTDAGVASHLDIWPDMIHVWQLFASRLDEGAEALADAGRRLHRAVPS